jgi:hypothetical protein
MAPGPDWRLFVEPVDEPPVKLDPGHVETGAPVPPPSDIPKAILWIPDPEQRHGWREFCVRPQPSAPKPKRSMGF